MKVLLLISAVILFANCTKPAEAVDVVKTPAPTATVESNQITVGKMTPLSKEESDAIDKAKQKEIEAQKEKLKNVPDELKNIDFKNFTYQSGGFGKVRLENGRVKSTDEKASNGRFWIELKEIYYTDLTGDGKKEAIVYLNAVGCGASCDGGSDIFFIYTVRKKKLSLIWHFESGSRAYGCSVKSLTVKVRQIYLETFGKCELKNNLLVRKGKFDTSLNKFESKDATHHVFDFNGSQIIQKAKTFEDLPKRRAGNYQTEINIFE